MKSLFQAIIMIVVGTGLVVGVGQYYLNLQNRPCYRPIAYSLGTFSNQFGITREEFLAALRDAENLWEVKADRNLFVYEADGGLKINLIYDERQNSTDALELLKERIDHDRAKLALLPTRPDAQAVGEFNLKVDELNKSIKNYNELVQVVGEKFKEGLYISDEQGERIIVYQFSNREQLVRLLAHEFGHALGLEHVADSEAIMYELNDSLSVKLTGDDIMALTNLCEADSRE